MPTIPMPNSPSPKDYHDNEGRNLGRIPRPFNTHRKKKPTDDFFGLKHVMEDGPILWKHLLSELIGTMTLTFIACASCIKWDPKNPPPTLTIAFAIGTARASVTQALGHISGAQINPAVTVSFIFAGYMGIVKGLLYIIFQCLGAILGALFLAMVVPKPFQGSLGCTVPHHMVSPLQACAVEAFIACFLCLTVFSVADEVVNNRNGTGRLELGFVIITCHIAALKITGASMNPARSLGPAVVANIWTHFWVYWVGPFGGAFLASVIYSSSFFMGKKHKREIPEDTGSDIAISASNVLDRLDDQANKLRDNQRI